MIRLELTNRQFRRLLDMVYIGNWILNSTRGSDRITEYDEVESLIFSRCADMGADTLYETEDGSVVPSREFREGGIHEAIADYEDAAFFDILAEELARRDMGYEPSAPADYRELADRMEEYLDEFEANGVENITLKD